MASDRDHQTVRAHAQRPVAAAVSRDSTRPTATDSLKQVRHLVIPNFDENELAFVAQTSPSLCALLEAGDDQLRELVANPFTLSLAANHHGLHPARRPGDGHPLRHRRPWTAALARRTRTPLPARGRPRAGAALRAHALAGTGDLREIETAAEHGDLDATLAIDVYTHRLGFLGVAVDSRRNHVGHDDSDDDSDISTDDAPVRTVVVTAREDLQIAREARHLLSP